MICTKCGNKNKDDLRYCDKCMTPLSIITESEMMTSQGITQQSIFLIIAGIMMILSVFVFPLFNATLANTATVEFKLFGSNIVKVMGFTGEVKIEPNMMQTFISVMMMAFPVIMLVCSFMKNYRIQNLFAVLNIALSAVLLVCMTLERNNINYDSVEMMPNMGLYSYMVLSVLALYSTQSIHEKVSVVVWVGAVVFAVGIILWFVGYTTHSSELTNGVAVSNNEIMGIVAVIAGGIIAIIGYEIELYSENPKKFYYTSTN